MEDLASFLRPMQELQAKIDEQSSLQEVPKGQLIFGMADFAWKDALLKTPENTHAVLLQCPCSLKTHKSVKGAILRITQYDSTTIHSKIALLWRRTCARCRNAFGM